LRRPVFALLSLAQVVAVSTCGGASRAAQDGIEVTPDGRRIVSQRAIERSGARTAWDALERTVPFFSFRDASRRGPARIEHRGRSSVAVSEQPIVYVDGAQLTDVSVLSSIAAADVLEIEVWSGLDATTYYGTGSGKGVIRIRTKLAGN